MLGNPLHVFNLIRRLAVDIPTIQQDWRQDDWEGELSPPDDWSEIGF